MTWAKFSDDFSDDCWELSDAAYRLHSEGLIWNARKLCDLRLPKADMRRWAKNPDAAAELVACGFWQDGGNHYEIVHHGRYQPTRDKAIELQAVSRENGKKGGRPKKATTGRERMQSKTQNVTQPGTQPGFDGAETSTEKPSQEPSQGAQPATWRVRTGKDAFNGGTYSNEPQRNSEDSAGRRPCVVCAQPADSAWWPEYCQIHEDEARLADQTSGPGW